MTASSSKSRRIWDGIKAIRLRPSETTEGEFTYVRGTR